jgi:hypothetical protein
MNATADFVARVNNAIINPILALIFAAALLYFLWGGFIFITSASADKGREEGRQHMLWGVIGMVIMVSVFAILRIFLLTVGVTNSDLPAQLPFHL